MSENSITDTSMTQQPRWERNFERFCYVLMFIGMWVCVALMTLTSAHAIGRYFLDTPIKGLVEMSQFMLVAIIFLTGAYTELKRGHLVIGLIYDRVPKKVQAVLDLILQPLCILVVAIAAWKATERGIYLIHTHQTSMFLKIPHFPFMFLTAFSWVVLIVAMIVVLIEFIHTAKRIKQ